MRVDIIQIIFFWRKLMKNKNFKLQFFFILFLFLMTSCIKNNSLNDEEIETKNEETIVSSLSISISKTFYIR